VLVVERHYRAGGFTHTFTRPGGFEWDVGVHYVGEVGKPGMLKSALDVATGGRVHFNRMPETFDRLSFPGLEFGIRAGKEAFRDDLCSAFPEERRAIDRYFRDMARAASLRHGAGDAVGSATRSGQPRPVRSRPPRSAGHGDHRGLARGARPG